MAKKRKYKTLKSKAKPKKASSKGVRYIAKVLKKYGGKKYKDYKVALEHAREVLKKLQDQNLSVNVRNINEVSRKHRGPKEQEKAPFVPPAMFDQSKFFEVIDNASEDNYMDLIAQTSNQIEFRSNITSSPNDVFKGGDKVTYETHFKDFADYCNRIMNLMRANGEVPTSDDATLISTTLPKKDKATGQWYCEIYTCDVYGEDQDYGFDKNAPKSEPTEIIIPNSDPASIGLPEQPKKITPEAPKPEPTKPEEPTKGTDYELEKLRLEQQERIKKAEIQSAERIKQDKLAQLKELLKDKVITFDEYLRGLKEI